MGSEKKLIEVQEKALEQVLALLDNPQVQEKIVDIIAFNVESGLQTTYALEKRYKLESHL